MLLVPVSVLGPVSSLDRRAETPQNFKIMRGDWSSTRLCYSNTDVPAY